MKQRKQYLKISCFCLVLSLFMVVFIDIAFEVPLAPAINIFAFFLPIFRENAGNDLFLGLLWSSLSEKIFA